MSLTPWKNLSIEVLGDNPYWKYCKGRFVAPHGKEVEYYFTQHPGAVAIVGVTDDGRIPWAWQYRPLLDRESLEIPMGGKGNLDAKTAAVHELAEEAKVRAENIELIGRHFATTGCSTEAVDIFLAWGLQNVEHGQDETEEFILVLMSPEEIEAAIQDGRIVDGMSISSWHMAKPRVLALIDQLSGKR